MLANKIIGFLGAGNMGSAIMGGLVDNEICTANHIWAADPDRKKLEVLHTRFRIRTTDNNMELIANCEVVVLAVKPQMMYDVLMQIEDGAYENTLFISIAAGIKSAKLYEWLQGKARVIRVMPNTPAMLSCGAAGICKGPDATDEDMEIARTIFDSVGVSVEIQEEQIDAVTAISGSGPAWFFYMMECLIEAGEEVGLSADDSKKLVLQTALGAARMASETGNSPAELREMVTSPKGTTFAGLEKLRELDFASTIKQCVQSTRDRSIELGSD